MAAINIQLVNGDQLYYQKDSVVPATHQRSWKKSTTAS